MTEPCAHALADDRGVAAWAYRHGLRCYWCALEAGAYRFVERSKPELHRSPEPTDPLLAAPPLRERYARAG